MCYHTCSGIGAHCAAHAHRQAGKPATLCICGMPETTYGHAVRTSQTIFIKINRLTFWHPKYEHCKPEHAEKDSHCHAQLEQG